MAAQAPRRKDQKPPAATGPQREQQPRPLQRAQKPASDDLNQKSPSIELCGQAWDKMGAMWLQAATLLGSLGAALGASSGDVGLCNPHVRNPSMVSHRH
jgi:hypothetical protein